MFRLLGYETENWNQLQTLASEILNYVFGIRCEIQDSVNWSTGTSEMCYSKGYFQFKLRLGSIIWRQEGSGNENYHRQGESAFIWDRKFTLY